jgi:ubiquinone biosynthesis protein
VIEETAGRPLSEVFVEFSEAPLASASIGQVHRATLLTGEGPVEVAVKVQRPGIRETIVRDLDLLYLLARLLERAVPETTIYSPVGLVGEFERAILAELDYQTEARHGERFARNFEGSDLVAFPRVFPEASGRRVLTAGFFAGLHIDQAMKEGYSGERIAKNAVQIIAQMIFSDGFFHADPHPGNIRILGPAEAPIVGMLDLGLVGEISPDMRDKIVDLMLAAVRKDVDDLAEALLALGRARQKVDRAAFRAEVARLSAVHLGKPLREIQFAAMVRDLVQGAIKFDIEMPTETMMVGKALMTVEGIGKTIYPELDVFEEAKPFLLKLIWQRYSPEKMGARLLKAAGRLGTAATDLPLLATEVLDDVRQGRLHLVAEDPGLGRAAERLGRRVVLGLIGAALIGSATALYLGGHVAAAKWLWAIAALVGLLAWGRVPDWWRERLKRKRG